jgi:hypothetical protein
MGPEEYPGDHVDLFSDGIVETPNRDYSWEEYYGEYGPEGFGETDSIIVARKNK